MDSQVPDGAVTVVGEAGTRMFQLLQWKYALKLEMIGLRHSSGRSVYAHVKRQLGFKGNKASVLTQLCAYIEERMPPKGAEPRTGGTGG